jgi:hypothetical protein
MRRTESLPALSGSSQRAMVCPLLSWVESEEALHAEATERDIGNGTTGTVLVGSLQAIRNFQTVRMILRW